MCFYPAPRDLPLRRFSMADRRGARIDILACLLLLAGLAVTVCILSHEAEGLNLLGMPGSWLAHELYQSLGLAVYVLLASWFVLVLFLLLRKSWKRWSL